MKLAKSAASRSPSGFAGSVSEAPGTRASGRGRALIAVGSLSDGEAASLTTVVSDASAATGAAAGTASLGGEGVTPGRAGALCADACLSIKRR